MAKLYVRAFGIACGLVGAVLSFIVSTLNIFFCLESGLNRSMARIYLGYRPTLFSVIYNSVLCFAFAFCVGSLIAWLYNRVIEESKTEIDDKIKLAARSIWESKGKPDGSSAEDWKEAQKKVRGF